MTRAVDRYVVHEWEATASIFDVWDLGGNGSIERDELYLGVFDFLDANGVSDTSAIMNEVARSNSLISRREFSIFLSKLASSVGVTLEETACSLVDQKMSEEGGSAVKVKSWDEFSELFELWDTDKSGQISRHELSVGMRKFLNATKDKVEVTLSECLTIMDEVDVDKDQQLDQMEFGAFLARFSLLSGQPLNVVTNFLLKDMDDPKMIHDGWKLMPILFETWDEDNSGTIDRSELTDGVRRMIEDNGLPISLEECYAIMDAVDLNQDEELDQREFGCFLTRFSAAADLSLDEVAYYLMKQQEDRLKDLEQESREKGWINMPLLFQRWDHDKNGFIDREELAMGIMKLLSSMKLKITLPESIQLMGMVDINGDGNLDEREFGAYLARFALAAGVPLDQLTAFLLEHCCEETCKTPSQKLFGHFLAKTNVGFAEECVSTMGAKSA